MKAYKVKYLSKIKTGKRLNNVPNIFVEIVCK